MEVCYFAVVLLCCCAVFRLKVIKIASIDRLEETRATENFSRGGLPFKMLPKP